MTKASRLGEGEVGTDEAGGYQGDALPTTYDFNEVFRQESAFVWRSARAFGVRGANVDDVVQDVFIVVHRRLADFDGRKPIRSWLLAILVRVLHQHRRKFVRYGMHDEFTDAADPTSGVGQLHKVANKEAGDLVRSILDSLDEDQRTVFVLAELEELSAPDIANIVGAPLNTVYSRLRLARKKFEQMAKRARAKDEWRGA